MESTFKKMIPTYPVKQKNYQGQAQDTDDMITPKKENDYLLNLNPVLGKKHVAPFNIKEESPHGIKTFRQFESKDYRIKSEGLKKIDTSGFYSNKASTNSKKNQNKEFHNHDYTKYQEKGQFGKQNERSWLNQSLGRAMVGGKLSSVNGNIDLGFECKTTQEEDTIEKVLKGKKRTHPFSEDKLGGHAYRQVEQDPGFFFNEGVIVGSTNLGRKLRQESSPRRAATKMLIDRPQQINKLPLSHNNTKQNESKWLDNELNQVDQLADWSKKNTKPIVTKVQHFEQEDQTKEEENVNVEVNKNDNVRRK